MKNPTWIYHKVLKPMVVSAEEIATFVEDGWSDTPATFTLDIDMSKHTGDEIIETDIIEIDGDNNSVNNSSNVETKKKDVDEVANDDSC